MGNKDLRFVKKKQVSSAIGMRSVDNVFHIQNSHLPARNGAMLRVPLGSLYLSNRQNLVEIYDSQSNILQVCLGCEKRRY